MRGFGGIGPAFHPFQGFSPGRVCCNTPFGAFTPQTPLPFAEDSLFFSPGFKEDLSRWTVFFPSRKENQQFPHTATVTCLPEWKYVSATGNNNFINGNQTFLRASGASFSCLFEDGGPQIHLAAQLGGVPPACSACGQLAQGQRELRAGPSACFFFWPEGIGTT